MIRIKTEKEIMKMRNAGKLAAELLLYLESFAKEGVSTIELNERAEHFTQKNNAISAPLGYHGFPKSICTSINNVVCHGIPDKNDILKSGDIVNIDVTPILDGYHGDTSKTVMIGNVADDIKKLVNRTEEALYVGIEQIKPDVFLYNIGKEIQNFIKPFKYSIVKDYAGHGIGKLFHEDPQVFHHYTKDNKIKLKPGMIFTVEPMINLGKSWRVITSRKDGWTVTTKDGSVSAQFEHTVLVTKEGYEILTTL